jgi:nitrous oxidase accessory protein NosD
VAVVLSALALPVPAAALEIGPDADLCAATRGLGPGDELVLRPGEYTGPCAIRHGGQPGAPVVIRAQDPEHPPRIVHDGRRGNYLEVRADHVVVRGLAFGPAGPRNEADGIRIYAHRDVTIEDCEFTGLGGIAVVANHTNLRGLVVRRNVVTDTRSTAMYFGCHDGVTCAVTDVLIEGNLIKGVTASDREIGYGVQIKLNSQAVIRDNVVLDTKGPGIMVYGARDPAVVSVIERNLVAGARRSSGIVLGGGPATIRNNVSLDHSGAGIRLEDYQKRGLLRHVMIAHNTVHGSAAGVLVAESGPDDIAVLGNAVHARARGGILPAAGAGVRLHANVDCSDGGCFANPDIRDFSPLSRLQRAWGAGAAALLNGARPPDDFFGVARGAIPVAGALERPAPALSLGRKP